MTTDPLESIQQAAERLRAVFDANDYRAGYGEAPEGLSDHEAEDWWIVKEEHDQLILMKFALSILPKGKRRPSSAPTPKEGDVAFGLSFGSVCDLVFRSVLDGRPPRWLEVDGVGKLHTYGGLEYPTEADAKLAMHWIKIDELKAAAAQ